MPSALVTGAAGFVGRWLCGALVDAGWSVTGLGLEAGRAGPGLDATRRDAVAWRLGDVRDRDTLAEALDHAVPDAIFHLAGVAYVPAAGADPGHACEVNVVAAARLLGLVRERRRAGTLDPTVLVVGSAEQYGRHDAAEMPLAEAAEQRPLTVYAASKAAQEVVALEAARSDGVRVIATRSFNHSGPGQDAHFLLPALVRRTLALRAEGGAALRLGNMEPVRDFLHVRDVVRAYVALASHGAPGDVYNVCSGRGTSVGELARLVLSRAGVEAALEQDPSLVRPADVPVSVGDPRKLTRATGWTPTVDLTDLIDDVIHAATH